MRTLPSPSFALTGTAASRHTDRREDDLGAWRDWAAHVAAGRIGGGIAADGALAGPAAGATGAAAGAAAAGG